MNNQIAALSEVVEHSLSDGWIKAHKVVRQPSKQMLLNHLYGAIMDGLMRLIEKNQSEKTPFEQCLSISPDQVDAIAAKYQRKGNLHDQP